MNHSRKVIEHGKYTTLPRVDLTQVPVLASETSPVGQLLKQLPV